MVIDPDVHVFQALTIGFRTRLPVEVRDNHAVYAEAAGHEFVPQAQHIHIVGDAKICAHLVLFDIHGTDDNDHLQLVLELHEHLKLGVRLKAREHAGSMVVVEQFAAKLHVEFVAELGDALLDVL